MATERIKNQKALSFMKIFLIFAALLTATCALIATNAQWSPFVREHLGLTLAWSAPSADGSVATGNKHEGGTASENDAAGHDHSGGHHAKHKMFVTSPVTKDVTLTQQYVAWIHSRRHIELCALEGGYLKEIRINEGQAVKKGDPLFLILPTIYAAKLDADLAEAQLAQVEYDNTKALLDKRIVSPQELKISEARLAKANAGVKLAQAEMAFANIGAPFDGIVDRLHEQEGSMIEEGTVLTT